MVLLTAFGLIGYVYAPVSSLKIIAFVLKIWQGGVFGVVLAVGAAHTV